MDWKTYERQTCDQAQFEEFYDDDGSGIKQFALLCKDWSPVHMTLSHWRQDITTD